MRTKGIGPNNLGMSKSPSKMMASPTKQTEYTRDENRVGDRVKLEGFKELLKEEYGEQASGSNVPSETRQRIMADLKTAAISEMRTFNTKQATKRLKKSSTSGR